MPKSYSGDLRERVIEAVEAGASRREAAESFNLCPSSAVKWLQRWHDTGSAKAKPTGGSTSPLEAHAERLLALRIPVPDALSFVGFGDGPWQKLWGPGLTTLQLPAERLDGCAHHAVHSS